MSTKPHGSSLPEKNPPAMAPGNWSELPDLLLLSIVHHLSTLLDFFAFAGVCRSWRSFLRSSAAVRYYIDTRPPLLLLPRNPRPTAGLFDLRTLDHPQTSLKSLLPPETLSHLCLGYSHGHLILLLDCHQPVISDVLTGAQIKPPILPSGRYAYYYAALTAPPSSSNSLLLLFYSQHSLLSYRPGEPSWSMHRLGPGVSYTTRVLPFKGRIFAVNDRAKLFEFNFNPNLTVKPLDVKGSCKTTVFDRWYFGPQLVECGGELLLVLFVQQEQGVVIRINVYRLDFERMVWLGVENLGDYSLFIDCGGRCPVSCIKPERWGGRSNCVYLAGPGCDSWREFALDGKMITDFSVHSPLSSSNLSGQRWPSPIWVYPSLFF